MGNILNIFWSILFRNSQNCSFQAFPSPASYLRSGNIYLPDERVFLMNLRTEAEYYQLMGLRRIIDRSLGWGRGREEEDKTKRNQEEQ